MVARPGLIAFLANSSADSFARRSRTCCASPFPSINCAATISSPYLLLPVKSPQLSRGILCKSTFHHLSLLASDPQDSFLTLSLLLRYDDARLKLGQPTFVREVLLPPITADHIHSRLDVPR